MAEEQLRGTDVWETLTAAIKGDLPTLQKLVRQNPRLVTSTGADAMCPPLPCPLMRY